MRALLAAALLGLSVAPAWAQNGDSMIVIPPAPPIVAAPPAPVPAVPVLPAPPPGLVQTPLPPISSSGVPPSAPVAPGQSAMPAPVQAMSPPQTVPPLTAPAASVPPAVPAAPVPSSAASSAPGASAQPAPPDVAPVPPNNWTPGNIAVLGLLNKVDGSTSQLQLTVGAPAQPAGDVQVSVQACANRPASQMPDTAVFLTIAPPQDGAAPLYRGWMVRSVPGATVVGNASETFRVISCT